MGDKIIALLRIATGNVERKIYARQCTIKKITNKEAKVLNDKIHLQGHRNAQVTYGLYYKDELVQLMSFSKTKYNRNLKSDNEWEIIRTGVDIKIKCINCGRVVMLPRIEFNKKLKKVIEVK